MKKALITGIAGQDGFYLAELLLEKGYEIHGIKLHEPLLLNKRADSSCEAVCVAHSCFNLHYAELTDVTILLRLLRETQPDEIYNMGSTSYIGASFEVSEHRSEVNSLGTLRLLEAVRMAGLTRKVRIYQTSALPLPTTLRQPAQAKFTKTSLYSSPKLRSHEILANYRAAHGLHACNGTLFNYEWPHRGEALIAQRITQGAVRIALGLQGVLYLNTLEERRDWGYVRDYAEAIWRVLQQNKPEDYVLATGVITTIREFVRLVFSELGIDIIFQGEGVREAGYVAACHNPNFSLMPGQTIVALDPIYYRSPSVEPSVAEASKARRQLGWNPRHDLRTLVREMVEHDLQLFRPRPHIIKAGHSVLQLTQSS